ncbi:3-oxoadipate enol-lactonase [Novosphingobium sp. 9]|uniref:3-oxoadipate enol-lactonase n=1 Tax=Novosphingobium sp. 9 TaxID=2025349 RepID=UPI0021B6AC52|nr:3-oxoadipate enol-lactonase [Novosphingobium sp. 9]
MPFTSVPGAQIYWKQEGPERAPALVLLNSIGTDMDLWEPMMPALRERFSVLRIDARGHGPSSITPGDLSLADLAGDVLAVADAAGIARFSLAGVSLGGMVGMELALAVPQRLEKLALVCTSATMDAAMWGARVETVRSKGEGGGMAAIAEPSLGRFFSEGVRKDNPGLCDGVLRQLLTMDPEGYAGCGAAIRDMDLADRIGAITCPTLVVTGRQDTSTPLEGHGEHLLAHIPGAAHVAVDAAHLPPLEAPEALTTALVPFLES